MQIIAQIGFVGITVYVYYKLGKEVIKTGKEVKGFIRNKKENKGDK